MRTEITVESVSEIRVVDLPGPVEQIAVSVASGEITVEVDTFYVGNLPAGNLAESSGYEHTQITPASNWLIHHHLHYRPAGIQVFDSAGEPWWPARIEYVDVDTLTLNFGSISFAGKAYIS